jgi:hypothetical protein
MHRIIPAGMEGMTFSKAQYSFEKAQHEAMFF